MYIAGVSVMGFELNKLIGDNSNLEKQVGEFIKSLPEGTQIPGASVTSKALWIIEQTKEELEKDKFWANYDRAEADNPQNVGESREDYIERITEMVEKETEVVNG